MSLLNSQSIYTNNGNILIAEFLDEGDCNILDVLVEQVAMED